MNPDAQVLMQRIGVLLDFSAFWFAAPEILGESRLVAFETALERGLERGFSIFSRGLIFLFGTLAIVIGSAYVASAFAPPEMTLGKRTLVTVALVLAFNIVLWIVPLASLVASPYRLSTKVLALFGSMGLLALLVYASFPIAELLNQNGLLFCIFPVIMPLAMMLSGKFRDWLNRRVTNALRILANDQQIRRRSLVVAAILFTVGFIIQMAATF